MVRLNLVTVWLTLIQVYAPTDDADSLPKMSYMEEVMNRVLRGDKPIVMGNFNGGVRKNVEVWNGVISGHGEDVKNDGGRRLLCFSTDNE